MSKSDGLKKAIGTETDPMRIAEIVAAYTLQQKRKADTATQRREWFGGVINHVRKVHPAQMDALVYEYAMSNTTGMTFAMWLAKKHPMMFNPPEKKVKTFKEHTAV